MSLINKIYPHVNVTTQALIRQPQLPADSDAPILFVPFISERGPANVLRKIFNLSQFVSEYGEPNYALQGRTILNVYNWLNAGGAVQALRLTSSSAATASNNQISQYLIPAGTRYIEQGDSTSKLYVRRINGSVGTWAVLNDSIPHIKPATPVNDSTWFDTLNKKLFIYKVLANYVLPETGTAIAGSFYVVPGATSSTLFKYTISNNTGNWDSGTSVPNSAPTGNQTAGVTMWYDIVNSILFISNGTIFIPNNAPTSRPVDGWDAGVSLPTSEPRGLVVSAKYPGAYYNGVKIVLKRSPFSTTSIEYVDAEIYLNNRISQTFSRLGESNFFSVLQERTEFIGSVGVGLLSGQFLAVVNTLKEGDITLQLVGGSDGSLDQDTITRHFFSQFAISGARTNPLITTTTNGENTTVSGGFIPSTFESGTLTFTQSLATGILKVGDRVKLTSTDGAQFIEATVSEVLLAGGEIKIFRSLGDLVSLGVSRIDTWNINLISISSVFAKDSISNRLEYPIDMILDAGYSSFTKQAIAEFTKESNGTRNDVVVIFDEFDFYTDPILGRATSVGVTVSRNHAVYKQKLIVNDVISGRDIWVSPTYFLASLFPTNDRIYGIQWPTAGLTRGVLNGVKGLNNNPTELERQNHYIDQENYVEKDSRGHRFMSQLTKEGENTALRFLNNVRVVNKMVRELEALGREYLFEFNDTATLLNMRNVLNRYVTEWIQNRTLNVAVVDVQKDPLSDEKVNVTLTIRFTGTIEIISIDITIE
jgi:hypothetical protein